LSPLADAAEPRFWPQVSCNYLHVFRQMQQ
jgi:hypothetical protein